MDEKDKKILDVLREDSSLTTRKIAKKTLIPITTVHKRIKRLRDEGVIKNYTVQIDYEKINRGLGVLVLANLDSEKIKQAKTTQKKYTQKICNLPEVEKTYHVTGTIDIVILVRLENTNKLEDFLHDLKEKFDAVKSTQTLVVLSEKGY